MMLIFFIVANLASTPADPIYLNNSRVENILQDGILRGSVSTDNELPRELYGSWSVTSSIIRTNDPYQFKDKCSDIWNLQKNKDIITLSNPVSGATASITVNEVKGNTAIFTRKNFTDKFKEYEQPKITVEGDNFYGTDTIVIEYYYRGKYIKTGFVEYEVKGTRISGPTLRDLISE